MPLDASVTEPVLSNDAAADWLRQWRTADRVCKEAQAARSAISKRAKADGVDVKALSIAVGYTKLEPDQVAQHLREVVRYANILRIPVTQDDLFAGWSPDVTEKTRAEDDLWDAQDRGYKDGRHARPLDECPYQPGTELHVAYTEFWHKGQASIARELGAGVTQASTARKRPSRAKQMRIPGTESQDRPRKRGRPRKDRSNGADAPAIQ
jgi:ribosome modulation factor